MVKRAKAQDASLAPPIGVLFVCLGNICRSPLAEAVFRSIVAEEGLADRFDIDSAGTSDYHAGDAPDPRTVEVAERRGVVLDHRARQITGEDLSRFDYILAMDTQNRERVQRLAAKVRPETDVHMLRAFDAASNGALEVPDPYFGGARGFEDVQAMVERACRGLLAHIRREHGG